jgi:putative transposase
MARQPRIVLPGQSHHIVQRGNNRSPVFFADDDYRQYLEWLRGAADQHGCAVHAYVLMTNHWHLLATPLESPAGFTGRAVVVLELLEQLYP